MHMAETRFDSPNVAYKGIRPNTKNLWGVLFY